MSKPELQGIECVDKLSDGVAITFLDGRSAFFTADLLYGLIGSAQELFDTDQADSDAVEPAPDEHEYSDIAGAAGPQS